MKGRHADRPNPCQLIFKLGCISQPNVLYYNLYKYEEKPTVRSVRSLKIVVLAGGLSPERQVSLVSGQSICRALRELGGLERTEGT